jgi:hypothetical protein
MNPDFDEQPSTFREEQDNIDWNDFRYRDDIPRPAVSLEFKDYIALTIAALQTIFLPLVVLGIVFFAFGLIFGLVG